MIYYFKFYEQNVKIICNFVVMNIVFNELFFRQILDVVNEK